MVLWNIGGTMKDQKKPITNHILIFLFFLAASVFTIMFFNLYMLVALGILVVVFCALGYTVVVLIGLTFGVAFWLVGFFNNLIDTISNPFGSLFGW